jgi:hypothetical protein
MSTTKASPDLVETEGVPLQLTELLEGLTCCHCRDPLYRYEMLAIWPAGNYTGHLHCWAQHHNVVRSVEASS